METTILLDHEPVADGGFLVRALLRIEGEAPPADGRVPLNLSLVLDRSGSMMGSKLAAARRAAAMLVRRLRPEDVVSVVAYDDEVRVVAEPATGEDQAHLPARIEAVEAGGSTNLSGGWLLGRELVGRNVREDGMNRILLLTDGLANVGITDPLTLVELCRAAAGAGITTTTIGFGADYDEDLLREMADAGRGNTYYIETVDQAGGIFEEELEGLLALSAQNVRVSVAPGADASFIRVAHDYPSHAEGNVLTLELGDLYAREPRRVLMEFLLRPREDGEDSEVAHLGVTAHVLTPGGGVEHQEVKLPVTLSPEEGGRVEPEVRREVLLLEAARAREEALEAQARGDFAAGAERLRAARERLRALGVDDPELEEEARDLERMAGAFETGAVCSSDVKYLKQRTYVTRRSARRSLRRFRREG